MKGVGTLDYSVAKELIRERIDPVILLEYYGISISDRSGRYNRVRTCCPLHDSDNPTAFSFDLNTKNFTCFTGHCGESPEDWWSIPKDGSASRDLFLFIKLMEEKKNRDEGYKHVTCSFTRALQIASEISGVSLDGIGAYDKDTMDKLDNQKWVRTMARVSQAADLDTFDETEIEMYKAMLPLCDYISTRRFEDDMLEFFEIGFSPDGVDEPYRTKFKDFPGRIIFPIRESGGSLVGWSGRLATSDPAVMKKHIKWMHKLDFEKGFVLYNHHNALPYIKKSKELILVEGPFDVARLWSYGICNAVAVMGSSLTPEQLQLAISSAFKIKVFLDGDGAGKQGATKICEQLKRYVDVYTITPEGGKDPDELTLEEAWVAVNSAKRYMGK